MVAAELTFASTGVPQADGTKGITGYVETPGSPEIEIIRVHSDSDGDYFYSRKFKKIKSILVQNHGNGMTTGVSRDSPKLTITQGTSTTAKVAISHTATDETFSFIIFGEL